jgi:zinc protease
MKKLLLSIAIIGTVAGAHAQNFDRSKRPQAGAAPQIKLDAPQTFTLPNGLKVFVVENHKVPSVSYQLDLDIMQALQGDAIGYKDFVGELLSAGTKNKSKDQFNEELDGIGASLAAGSEGIYAQSLTKHQDKLLSLMSDMILNPNFTQEELDKIKTQTISGLKTQEDDAGAMSGNLTKALVYGPKHAYGEIMTEQTVNKVKLEDCIKYYKTYFKPNVSYMAIVGDITLEQAKTLVTKYFGKWEKASVPRASYEAPKSNTGARVAVTNKSGAVQSVVNVTYPIDLRPGSVDVIPMRVANDVLGGGSSGRLFQNLREKHGWTYGCYSSVSEDILPNAGSFSAEANCRTEVTDSSLREILSEMNRLRNEPVDAKDIDAIKKNMAGKFALRLEDPKTIARYAINTMKYKLPKDYYSNYLKNLAAVTPADVQRVAQKYITPGVAIITVAGDKNEIAEKIKTLSATGKIEYYDVFGSPVKDEPKKAVPSNVTPESVVKGHIAAVGGEDAWKNVKDVKSVMALDAGSGAPQSLTMTEIKKAPNKTFTEIKMGEMIFQKSVFDGTKGYQEMQGQKMDMDAAAIAEAQDDASFQQEIGYLREGLKMELVGQEKVEGVDAYAVRITKKDGKTFLNYYDVNTKLKVKNVTTMEAQGQKVTSSMTYGKYQEVKGGLKYPFEIKQSVAGQNIKYTVKSVELNTDVSDDTFK